MAEELGNHPIQPAGDFKMRLSSLRCPRSLVIRCFLPDFTVNRTANCWNSRCGDERDPKWMQE